MPGLLLTVPYTAVQFFTLQTVRNFTTSAHLESTAFGHLSSFGSGAVAGAAATAASYPFDLLRTTLAAQGEPKVPHCSIRLFRNGLIPCSMRDSKQCGIISALTSGAGSYSSSEPIMCRCIAAS